MIEYSLLRSKRKTIALYIKNAAIEVRAPLKTPIADIERFILSKEKWIKDKLAAQSERQQLREKFELTYGDTVVCRGQEYPIVAGSDGFAGFDGECFFIPPGLTAEQIKLACTQIYRAQAEDHMISRVAFFAGHMGVSPAAVKINGAKTRWGSCSGKKSLNFSWRLMMADDDVIDYVVVHELAHISEMNHSAKFWAIVANILPNYTERKLRLKRLYEKISNENWD